MQTAEKSSSTRLWVRTAPESWSKYITLADKVEPMEDFTDNQNESCTNDRHVKSESRKKCASKWNANNQWTNIIWLAQCFKKCLQVNLIQQNMMTITEIKNDDKVLTKLQAKKNVNSYFLMALLVQWNKWIITKYGPIFKITL